MTRILVDLLLASVTCLIVIASFISAELYTRICLQNKELEDYLSEVGSKEVYSNDPDLPGTEDPNFELEYEDPEFDNRIARLKEELIASNFPTHKQYESTEAEIGAEGIYNIPHNEVNVYGGEEGIEISK